MDKKMILFEEKCPCVDPFRLCYCPNITSQHITVGPWHKIFIRHPSVTIIFQSLLIMSDRPIYLGDWCLDLRLQSRPSTIPSMVFGINSDWIEMLVLLISLFPKAIVFASMVFNLCRIAPYSRKRWELISIVKALNQ